MTRCLDCGSQRTSDQCPNCGLTSAAAELVFRRRLIRQTAYFLVGSLLFPYLSQVYPPLDLDAMLVFFGLIFFLALAIAIILDRQARGHKDVEILRHLFTGLVPIPFILSVGIFLNGKFDSSRNVIYHPTVVVGRYHMTGIVRGTRRVFVQSWREGRKIERLAVDPDDFDRFHVGDSVNVGEESGALGIPWFYGIYRAGQSAVPLPPETHLKPPAPSQETPPAPAQ